MRFRRPELAQREPRISEADKNIEIAAAERQRALEACRGLLMPLLRVQNDGEIEMGLRNPR